MVAPPVADELTPIFDLADAGGAAGPLLDHLADLAAGPARVVVLYGLDAWTAQVSTVELRALQSVVLPIVAAFEGELAGPALDLVLAADIRVAGTGAAIRARNVGSRRLLALAGPIASVDLFSARGSLDAEGLLAVGLVSDVVPAGEALNSALAIAVTIASRGPIATRFAKEAIWRGLDLPFVHALRFETDLTLLLQTTKDRAEGVRAFMEKRPPIFTGD